MEIKEKESGLSVEIKENAGGLVKTGLTTTLKRRKI